MSAEWAVVASSVIGAFGTVLTAWVIHVAAVMRRESHVELDELTRRIELIEAVLSYARTGSVPSRPSDDSE